jgi:hypothetical protein
MFPGLGTVPYWMVAVPVFEPRIPPGRKTLQYRLDRIQIWTLSVRANGRQVSVTLVYLEHCNRRKSPVTYK